MYFHAGYSDFSNAVFSVVLGGIMKVLAIFVFCLVIGATGYALEKSPIFNPMNQGYNAAGEG